MKYDKYDEVGRGQMTAKAQPTAEGTDGRVGQVQQELAEIHKAVEHNDAMLNVLLTRIHPVLRDEPRAQVDPESKAGALVSLADAIRDVRWAIELQTSAIEYALTRLEL